MYDGERIKSRSQVVDYNAGALGQPFQSADGKRFPHIEDTKKYKAREKSFPSERDGDKSNELSGNFIDDDELRILGSGGARDARSGGNSDEGDGGGGGDRGPRPAGSGNMGTGQSPHHNRGDRTPGAGAGFEESR